MKLLTIDRGPYGHVGAIMPNGEVLDIAALALVDPAARLVPQTVRGILEVGPDALDLVKRCIDRAGKLNREDAHAKLILRALADTSLLAPIPEPRLILSVGMNYGRHLKEMSGTPTPTHPTAFIKPMSSLTGSGKPIFVPPQCPVAPWRMTPVTASNAASAVSWSRRNSGVGSAATANVRRICPG